MDFYSLSATAIPALWVAAGLMTKPRKEPPWWPALGRSLLRVLLISGEVAAMTTVATRREGWLGVALTLAALTIGSGVVVLRVAAADLKRVGVPTFYAATGLAILGLVVFGYATKR